MSRIATSRERVLTLMRTKADADGVIRGMAHTTIAHLTHTHSTTVGDIIAELISQGRLTRLVAGNSNRSATYALPAEFQVKPSIESVTRMVTDYRWQGHGEPSRVPVSLPRLRCLENSGVAE